MDSRQDIQAILTGLRDKFLLDLPERLNDIEDAVMAMEDEATAVTAFDELYRNIHSLKGSGGTHGLHIITSICHQMEDSVAELNGAFSTHTSVQVTTLLAYVDLLRQVPDHAALGNDFSTLTQALNELSLSNSGKEAQLLLVMDKTLSAAIKSRLKGKAIKVTVIKDGLLALEMLLGHRYDMLIASHYIDMLNGQALIAALKLSDCDNKKIKTVLVSTDPLQMNNPVQPDFIFNKDQALFAKLEPLFDSLGHHVLQQ
ncbi:MAG: Hpt domain-containing protein [Mariprofundus sp.]|nr:Hpt domain-containing protein [Mariprofundus sp.]